METAQKLKGIMKGIIPLSVADEHRPAKALDAGCSEYDSKPVNLPRLLGKIEALLASSGSPQ